MPTFRIKPGYRGQCLCGNEAKHEEWVAFKDVQPYPPHIAKELREAGLPDEPPKGVYHYVCDNCRKH